MIQEKMGNTKNIKPKTKNKNENGNGDNNIHCRRKRAGNGGGCKFHRDEFEDNKRQRIYEDVSKGPIAKIQRNPNAGNRPEYVHAIVKREHLQITDQNG